MGSRQTLAQVMGQLICPGCKLNDQTFSPTIPLLLIYIPTVPLHRYHNYLQQTSEMFLTDGWQAEPCMTVSASSWLLKWQARSMTLNLLTLFTRDQSETSPAKMIHLLSFSISVALDSYEDKLLLDLDIKILWRNWMTTFDNIWCTFFITMA